ncbi:60S ribosomal protein L32 [Trachipleistophora hominis]|uniref:60S ribosomal protein L32 n=1 Tax=Trachipleistophora hominis TaxID=72359 RepID=L7K031_TRAHO|nr:60S ribosomal protein L32 [Trachipleistophora hominis]
MAQPVAQLENVLTEINTSKCKKTFNRFKSDRFKRVKPSWRHPRGIDNRVRRKFRGTISMPNKGFKTASVIKNLTPDGYRKVMVSNVRELEALKSLNTYYCAEIRHGVGAKKRIEIVSKADEYNIVVTNRTGKLVEDAK